jgi:hypothetical protein
MAPKRNKLTADTLREKEHRLPCGECDRETKHSVLESATQERNVPGSEFRIVEKYQIVQCKGCETITFRISRINTQDSVWDEATDSEIHHERIELYPNRVAGRHKLRESPILSFEVGGIYDETHRALCGNQPILAGIGMRALIEAVCMEKGAKGGNLRDKIDALVGMGILTPNAAQILQTLRGLGNAAAHQVKPPDERALNIAMDVVEHLLRDVYILPRITGELSDHKKAKAQTSESVSSE